MHISVRKPRCGVENVFTSCLYLRKIHKFNYFVIITNSGIRSITKTTFNFTVLTTGLLVNKYLQIYIFKLNDSLSKLM